MVSFAEVRRVELGIRAFRNEDPPPRRPRPGAYDLGWSRKVVQEGTRDWGGVSWVQVCYHDGSSQIFEGEDAHYVLTAVAGLRSDVPRLNEW